MLNNIIKEHLEYHNLSQKELGIKTGLSMQLISELISGKRKPQISTILKLEKAFNIEPFSLFLTYQNYLNYQKQKNDQELLKIVNYLETLDTYKLLARESLLNLASQKLQANTVQEKRKEVDQLVVGFYKYKDKPLAYLWFSILEQKYANLQSQGIFKKSSKNTVFKGMLDILINNGNINKRLDNLKIFLDKHGIILINAPFIPDSTIKGMCFKRNNQRFIFMSDMGKREYSYIFTLIHELIHFYYDYDFKDESIINKQTKAIILDYFAKYQKTHSELLMSFTTYQSDEKNKWEKLHQKTKLKINFGNFEKLLS